MTSDIESTLRTYISKFIRTHDPKDTNLDLKDDQDIFATGFVNSMFAMQLVQFIESKFGLVVDSEDLEIDNFRSIDAMTRFIERKQNQSTGA